MTLLVRIVMFLLHNHVPHLETFQQKNNLTEGMKQKKKNKKINKNPNKYEKKKVFGIKDPSGVLSNIFEELQ